ncbi:MAG: Uma2 family endonuclease [Lachnospiraceae bacterium]|nr:Uma2 family endonuclease [Lachnospiraceae bacterium]
MTLQEIKKRKQELGYSNETLSKRSGVPLGTVQKVLAGVTKNPRQKTLEALSDVLRKETNSYSYEPSTEHPSVLQETALYEASERKYTIEDIYALPENVRAELINGKLYYMAAPTRTHQKLAGGMHLAVANYIRSKNGSCEVYIPRFAVFPFNDEETYLEPDLTVVCDLSKLDEKGCHGAPDWVVEVLSPGTSSKDMGIKLFKYREAGVREYWILDPEKKIVIVENYEGPEGNASLYSFDNEIPSGIFPDLLIRPADFL